MPISFACPCGRELCVSDDDAGLPVVCPACQCDVTAPGALVRPWVKRERGTLLDAPAPGALPLVEPENPLAFIAPGEAARDRERAVREAERQSADQHATLEVFEDFMQMGVGIVVLLLGLGFALSALSDGRNANLNSVLGAGAVGALGAARFYFSYLRFKFKQQANER